MVKEEQMSITFYTITRLQSQSHTWLKVIVDDRWLDLVEIFERMHHLHNDRTCLAFGNALVLLEIKVQIMSITILEHRAERIGIDLEHIVQTHHARMVELLVDVVLAQRVLYVVSLLVILPVLVQLVNLAGNVALLLQIERLVHFRETAWVK